MPRSQLKMPLQPAEQNAIDKIMRCERGSATDALKAVNEARRRNGVAPVHKSSVHRYVRGVTHKRGRAETRGRKRALSPLQVRALNGARLRLLKRSDNDHQVLYADIQEEAGLSGVVCKRVCEDALRGEGVRFRKPRSKIYLTEEDAKRRKSTCESWLKHPPSFWSRNVHAYVDNKSWVMPLTPKQRRKYKQTLITGHLRKASEGTRRGCTKPRQQHSFLGIPSATVTAAVAKDSVILWHVHEKPWNGQAAAETYQGPLLKALRRTWGMRTSYRIIEDGDRKGNQSKKGIDAKVKAGIYAMVLPPRTPSLMPLDYAIWKAIDNKVVRSAPRGTETKHAFLARLARCAKSLPRGFVQRQIHRMKRNIQAIVDAGGYTPSTD